MFDLFSGTNVNYQLKFQRFVHIFCFDFKLNACLYMSDARPLILRKIMLAREEQRFSVIFLILGFIASTIKILIWI